MTLSALRPTAQGGKRALAAALARLERDPDGEAAQALLDAAWREPCAHVVGVTGPPGVGKSSLCAALVAAWRRAGKTVGVIAVDPSSRASGGALLGDRVRIVHDSADEGSFVRSMAARDHLGGLAEQTLAAMVLMRALFDRVLIETVGVGQSETDVAGVADTVVFCVQPGSGDSLQFMKAGIVEIPHLIVVTKADLGPAAERARADVAGALSLAMAGDGGWPLRTLAVSSRSGAGMEGLMAALEAHRAHLAAAGRLAAARHRQSEGWIAESLRERFGREGIARLGRLGFDLSLAPGGAAVSAAARARCGLGESAMSHPTDGNCIFCKIVAGQIPCFKLLEDDETIAFMDINPVNPGHALAVAKGHWPTVDVIPPEVLAAVAKTAQRVAKAVTTELKPVGINLLQANGAGAGQSVPHLHIHIMPRRANDGVVLNWQPRPGDMAGIEAIYKRLKAALT